MTPKTQDMPDVLWCKEWPNFLEEGHPRFTAASYQSGNKDDTQYIRTDIADQLAAALFNCRIRLANNSISEPEELEKAIAAYNRAKETRG